MTKTLRRVLIVYNRYLERGGEDEVFEAEADLLQSHGIEVLRLEAAAERPATLRELLRVGGRIIWSQHWRRELIRETDRFRPDLVHVHNWFPTMSPAIFWGLRRTGVPVVVTLHNYRLTCVRATLFRSSSPCELCVGLPASMWGIMYGCYHSSRVKSSGLAASQLLHNVIQTWQNCVDAFIAPSEFARQIFVRTSLPRDRIHVKRNFLYRDPGMGSTDGSYIMFAGRLSEEKGVRTLLAAMKNLPNIPFVVAGTGPLKDMFTVPAFDNLNFLDRVPRAEVERKMKEARAVIVPSQWYENAPLVVIEAFACGKPVIASRLGGLEECISDGQNGMLFSPGDSEELSNLINKIWSDSDLTKVMGANARKCFEKEYSASANLARLLEIYEQARSVRLSGDS